MTESTSIDPRLQGEIAIIAKAWKDETFKQALLSNPKTTIEQEFGFQYPDGVNVQVIETQSDVLYIRLPEKPDNADSTSIEDLVGTLSETQGTALAQVIAKAWKDEAFKQSLLDHPKTVLSQEFGTALPDSLTVQILPESAKQLVLILPNKPDTATELSDEELEAVSGGITPAALIFPFATAAVANAGLIGGVATGATVLAATIGGGVTQTFGAPW